MYKYFNCVYDITLFNFTIIANLPVSIEEFAELIYITPGYKFSILHYFGVIFTV